MSVRAILVLAAKAAVFVIGMKLGERYVVPKLG